MSCVANSIATPVKLSDQCPFPPLRAMRNLLLPADRNIHPSDAVDQRQRDERAGSWAGLRQNQDIRAVDNPLDLFRHYFLAKPPHEREPS